MTVVVHYLERSSSVRFGLHFSTSSTNPGGNWGMPAYLHITASAPADFYRQAISYTHAAALNSLL